MIGKTIGQYQVIDKIGEGGMGAVYKAEDTTLHRLVALKTLSGHLTEDEEAKERFVREAQSASSLNHPNITTVYEFLEDEDTRLICMEYVEGKTIRDMVESGIVSVRKAIDIIIQAAEALEAAHNKGILHRDVKSANIMVNMEGRVKVMDFGLAHLEERSQLTRTGTTMGTLSYASPEQISGRSVDRRSEIFSLGVVFYELLSGQLPFRASNEAEIVFAIINNEPPKLTKVRDDVPELVEAIVSRMLEKESELRYKTCGEVISDLKGIRKEMETSTVSITGTLEQVRAGRRKALVTRLAIGAGAILVAAAAAVLLIPGGRRLDPNTVVVVAFENRTGDSSLEQLGQLAADMITQGIQGIELVDVIPFRSAHQISQALMAEDAGRSRDDLLKALGRETSAGTAISGAIYLLDEETVRFTTEITDLRRGKLLKAPEAVTGPRRNPEEVIERLTQRVLGSLAPFFDTQISGAWASTLPSPPSYEAYKAYSEGWDLFGHYRYDEAIQRLYHAASLDTGFVSPLLFSAVAHLNMGRDAKADSLAGVVSDYRDRLAPADRIMLDWLRAKLTGDLLAQYQASQKFVEIDPTFGYQAGYDARRVNRPREALAYLKMLDPESPSVWSAYFGRLTEAYHMLGQYRKELKAAQWGRRLYPQEYGVLNCELRALAALGKLDQVEELIDESLSLPPSETSSPGGSMRLTALELNAHGYPEEASLLLERVIRWYENRPVEEESRWREPLATTLYAARKWEEARALFEELAAGDPENITYKGYLGCIAARTGNHEQARQISGVLTATEIPYLREMVTYWRAAIAAVIGSKDQAVTLLRKAFGQGLAHGLWLHRDINFESLHDFPPFQEWMRPKG